MAKSWHVSLQIQLFSGIDIFVIRTNIFRFLFLLLILWEWYLAGVLHTYHKLLSTTTYHSWSFSYLLSGQTPLQALVRFWQWLSQRNVPNFEASSILIHFPSQFKISPWPEILDCFKRVVLNIWQVAAHFEKAKRNSATDKEQ